MIWTPELDQKNAASMITDVSKAIALNPPVAGSMSDKAIFATNEARRCSSAAKAFLVPRGSLEDEVASKHSDVVLPECGAFVTGTLHFRVGATQSRLSALRPVAEWRRPRQNRKSILNIAWVLASRL
jgi:hypothetical protein